MPELPGPPVPERTRARDLLAADLRRGAYASHFGPLGTLARTWLLPRFRAVVLFRVSGALHHRRLTRPLALMLAGRVLRASGAELSPGAQVGPGLVLNHTTGIVLGLDVVLGANATLHQGVTLGAAHRHGPSPTLGDDVRIGVNAVVLGDVTVGDGAEIAAGAVVVGDVPAGALVGGVPARVLRP